MKREYIKAFNACKKAGLPVYEHADDRGNFSISAEDGDARVDYYSNYWVPEVAQILSPHGLYAEWVNPGRISVYPV